MDIIGEKAAEEPASARTALARPIILMHMLLQEGRLGDLIKGEETPKIRHIFGRVQKLLKKIDLRGLKVLKKIDLRGLLKKK